MRFASFKQGARPIGHGVSLRHPVVSDQFDYESEGAPAGVGAARKPPLFMIPGDVCEVEIERIGVLRNVVA